MSITGLFAIGRAKLGQSRLTDWQLKSAKPEPVEEPTDPSASGELLDESWDEYEPTLVTCVPMTETDLWLGRYPDGAVAKLLGGEQ